MDRPLITAEMVAERLGMSTKWVYGAAKSGELPSVRVTGRSVRFDPDVIDTWLAKRHGPREVER